MTSPSFAATSTPPIINQSILLRSYQLFFSHDSSILDCLIPAITLIPSVSSLASPLHHRRNQDVFISSFVDLSCMSLLSINTQWTITSCTPVCSSPIAADHSIITTFAEIYIPRRALAYGTYQLKLTVTLTSASKLTASASAYVKISPSGITANLFPYGTSTISLGYEQDLTLDPGRYSVDLDGHIFNASVSEEI